MQNDRPFDAAQVASLARELTELEIEVAQLREAARQATQAQNSAECRLANKRTAFTLAVKGQLDLRSLPDYRRLEVSA